MFWVAVCRISWVTQARWRSNSRRRTESGRLRHDGGVCCCCCNFDRCRRGVSTYSTASTCIYWQYLWIATSSTCQVHYSRTLATGATRQACEDRCKRAARTAGPLLASTQTEPTWRALSGCLDHELCNWMCTTCKKGERGALISRHARSVYKAWWLDLSTALQWLTLIRFCIHFGWLNDHRAVSTRWKTKTTCVAHVPQTRLTMRKDVFHAPGPRVCDVLRPYRSHTHTPALVGPFN